MMVCTQKAHPLSDNNCNFIFKNANLYRIMSLMNILNLGPRTLQLKLQKKSLSSILTTTFFHNCNDFFNSFIYGQRFSQFFWKNRCENLCMPLTLFFENSTQYQLYSDFRKTLNFFSGQKKAELSSPELKATQYLLDVTVSDGVMTLACFCEGVKQFLLS